MRGVRISRQPRHSSFTVRDGVTLCAQQFSQGQTGTVSRNVSWDLIQWPQKPSRKLAQSLSLQEKGGVYAKGIITEKSCHRKFLLCDLDQVCVMPFFFKSNCIYLFCANSVCVCVVVQGEIEACMWKLEANLQESSSSIWVSPWDQIQISRLGDERPYLLSHPSTS